MRFAYQEILVSVDREDRSSLQFLDFLLQRLYLASEIDLAQASFCAQFDFIIVKIYLSRGKWLLMGFNTPQASR